MGTRINRFGLTDYIPEAIKRKIRCDAGFGCVICGSAFYHYEHIDPEFHDAREHDPGAMTLLCGGCHDRVTRRQLSKETVKRARSNPITKRKGFSFGILDIAPENLTIFVGNVGFRKFQRLIALDDLPVISLLEPLDDGEPLRISAIFTDDNGRPVLAIKNNEWRLPITVGDATVIGNRLLIRQKNMKRSLVMRSISPSEIIIEKAMINIIGHKIVIDEASGLAFPGGGGLSNLTLEGNGVGTGVNLNFGLSFQEKRYWHRIFEELML